MLGYTVNTKKQEVIYLGTDVIKSKKGTFYKIHCLDKSSTKVTPLEFLTSWESVYNKTKDFTELTKVVLLLNIQKVNYKILDKDGNATERAIYTAYLQDLDRIEE